VVTDQRDDRTQPVLVFEIFIPRDQTQLMSTERLERHQCGHEKEGWK